MAAQVEIANAALIELGHEAIESFLDDSDAARAVNAKWGIARDYALAAHPWNFATQRHELAAAAEVTLATQEWSVAYTMPTDALRVLYIEPRGTPYVVENGYILTDASAPLYVPCIMRVVDTQRWSPVFTQAFVYLLCAMLCQAITARRNNAMDYWKLYQMMLQEARTIDGQEGWEGKETDSPIGFARIVGTNFSANQLTDGEWL